MRIHSSVLTAKDLHSAIGEAGLPTAEVWVETLTQHRSTKRERAFEVRLAATQGRDRNGKARRPRNSGFYGAESGGPYLKAATYDEHGYWMAVLFAKDPEAIVGPYKGVSEFNQMTRYKYDGVTA